MSARTVTPLRVHARLMRSFNDILGYETRESVCDLMRCITAMQVQAVAKLTELETAPAVLEAVTVPQIEAAHEPPSRPFYHDLPHGSYFNGGGAP